MWLYRSISRFPRACASALFAAFGAASGAGFACAHHSFADYDLEIEQVLAGTVVEFQWISPHTWTILDVADESGRVVRWRLEGQSPNHLGRRGWTRYSLTPGDRVEAAINPSRSGDQVGNLRRVTFPDGTVKVSFGTRDPL